MKSRSLVPVFLATALGLAGCSSQDRRAYEYMPDMARDPAYKAFAPNPVTRDGLTLQHPVAAAPFRAAIIRFTMDPVSRKRSAPAWS